MQKGFDHLETGKYQEATSFFKEILKKYPDNKTAKLCYGRAIGLEGNAIKAVAIFTEMMETYPEDYEIQLNYSEALLWNKQYDAAENYYKQLVATDLKEFPRFIRLCKYAFECKKIP